ncbi:MAG: OsmC family protein [Solirubrobacterales bacterium]
MTEHTYETSLRWSGDRGEGTADYRSYGREHVISAAGKPDIAGSADPMFRGDAEHWNPEELLVAALSSCHLLMYLHLCADAGAVVVGYEDEASGIMTLGADGGGEFREVVLRPRVTVLSADMIAAAAAQHERAHALCFIARSVNFPVRHEPQISAR